jgi:DNA (cytosine-5)-methyltransferase 1
LPYECKEVREKIETGELTALAPYAHPAGVHKENIVRYLLSSTPCDGYNDTQFRTEARMITTMGDISSERLQILQKKTFAEFFAGIGLVRAGLERQGWSIAFANDIDPLKYQMYRERFTNADDHFVLEDVFRLNATDIPYVTLATASFPCKDLSLAGSFNGFDGKHSSEVWGFTRILERLKHNKPPIVLLENVAGFLRSGKGEAFRLTLQNLNDLGYAVDAFILDAANFVPQSRQRLFIIGLLEDIFPVDDRNGVHLLGLESVIRPRMLASFIAQHPNIRWNVRRLPLPPTDVPALETILEDLPEDNPLWWNPERASYLLSQMSPLHRETAERMISGERWSYGTVFRRMRNGKSTAELRTDGIAGCLRTPAGGSAKQILFKAGHGRYFARLITPREAARLMGADDYQITVPSDQALFGFGDAVCVPVIEWIASNYLNPIIEERTVGETAERGLQKRLDRLYKEWLLETNNNGALRWGKICAGITLVESLLRDYSLNLDDHLTERGTQLKAAGQALGNRVLERFGATERIVGGEFGRTNRGTVVTAADLLKLLEPLRLEGLPQKERNEHLLHLEELMASDLLEFLRREREKVDFEPFITTERAIADLLEKSPSAFSDAIAHHLVGAKLELQHPELFANNALPSRGGGRDRSGNFFIGETIFLITVSPEDAVYEKCAVSLAQGCQVHLLVPTARLSLASTKARKYGIAKDIVIQSIESFVSQTLDERAGYSRAGATQQREEFVRVYNRRVNEAGDRHAPLLTLNDGMLEIEEMNRNKPEGVHNHNAGPDFVYPQDSLFDLLEEGGAVKLANE